jgi:hypothetical protein
MSEPAPTPSNVRRDYPSLRSDYIQPTLGHALRVWWAFYWRTNVVTAVATVIATLALRLMYENVLITATYVRWGAKLAPYIFSYGTAIFVLRFVLHKRFRHFRMAVWSQAEQPSAMDEKPAWRRVIRVWWAFSWRSLIFSLVGSVVVGYPMGLMLGMFAPPPVVVLIYGFGLGMIVRAGVELFVIYANILDENMADFHVGLLAIEAPAQLAAESAEPVPTSAT